MDHSAQGEYPTPCGGIGSWGYQQCAGRCCAAVLLADSSGCKSPHENSAAGPKTWRTMQPRLAGAPLVLTHTCIMLVDTCVML